MRIGYIVSKGREYLFLDTDGDHFVSLGKGPIAMGGHSRKDEEYEILVDVVHVLAAYNGHLISRRGIS